MSREMIERNVSPHRLAASGETAPTSLKPAGRLLSESVGALGVSGARAISRHAYLHVIDRAAATLITLA
jgi:hypothetical protein